MTRSAEIDLVPVILSGGSGTRLWPMSREFYPKQFHHLTGEWTLLQQTVRRILPLCDPATILVIGNGEHRFMLHEQLAGAGAASARVMLEPVARNTAPAVALAAFAACEHDPAASLLVLPADHVITDESAFRATVERALPLARDGALLTFGIPATRPETGFGYIRCGTACGDQAWRVDCFVEKPDASTAADYVASGDYYWNSGMFLLHAATYLEELKRLQPTIHAGCLAAWRQRESFHEYERFGGDPLRDCPSLSIDYAVMEHTRKAVMARLDAGWNDVGSWAALYRELPADSEGNVVRGDVICNETRDCLLYAHDRLLATHGIRDLVVVETADAVLVADRGDSAAIGELTKTLAARQREETRYHRRVMRPWGSYTVLEKNANHQVKRLSLDPGATLSLQRHRFRAEHWVVVHGEASVVRGDERIVLRENESTYIPAGMVHQLANHGSAPLEVIEVQTGSYLGEDDIERLEDPYQRTGEAG